MNEDKMMFCKGCGYPITLHYPYADTKIPNYFDAMTSTLITHCPGCGEDENFPDRWLVDVYSKAPDPNEQAKELAELRARIATLEAALDGIVDLAYEDIRWGNTGSHIKRLLKLAENVLESTND